MLSSPGFLYIQESPGKLDDYSLATRLALFLWNSQPDSELRSLAAAGRLHNPEVLRAQTERLLNDPKSRRFVDAFTDYWLDLRKIDDTSPSSTLYNDYELDDPLKLAAVEETRLFVQELFARNLPARTIVDSDFTFLNERLAQHYGIPGVTGAAMRKVTLPKDSVRGGLLTQASVLKVTANGTTTSPVMRGVWIMERILGYRTAPPPAVPAIEPDIRGAVTIRQQLDKHRADATCASCHRKIDPPGFALESFDVMGGWRDRYRAFADGVKPEPGIGLSGQPFAFRYGLPVDSAGDAARRRSFKDIREFKRLLLDHEEQTVARNLVGQLATYATGAPIGFSDRKQVEEILDKSRDSGLRSPQHRSGHRPERSVSVQVRMRRGSTDGTRHIARCRAARCSAASASALRCRCSNAMLPLAPRAAGRRPAPHVRHLQQPRRSARRVLPRRCRPRLHAVALSEDPRGPPQGLHRLLRRLAPQRRWRPSVRYQLPHGRSAPGQQFVPQHHLARPVHRRAHRQPDPLSFAHAGRQHRGALSLLDR